MESDEIRRSIEFLREHPDIRIENESELEQWKEIAPSSLHKFLDRQLAIRAMSFREKINYLEASRESINKAAKEVAAITAQFGSVSDDCLDEESARLFKTSKEIDEELKALRKRFLRRRTDTDANEGEE